MKVLIEMAMDELENASMGGIGGKGPTLIELDDHACDTGMPWEGNSDYHTIQRAWRILQKAHKSTPRLTPDGLPSCEGWWWGRKKGETEYCPWQVLKDDEGLFVFAEEYGIKEFKWHGPCTGGPREQSDNQKVI
jgi:hypothetical protein